MSKYRDDSVEILERSYAGIELNKKWYLELTKFFKASMTKHEDSCNKWEDWDLKCNCNSREVIILKAEILGHIYEEDNIKPFVVNIPLDINYIKSYFNLKSDNNSLDIILNLANSVNNKPVIMEEIIENAKQTAFYFMKHYEVTGDMWDGGEFIIK